MGRERAVIWGAGGTGRRVRNMIKDDATVCFFVDNDPEKWGVLVKA